jgi:Flp pilus assembly protein TadD
VRLLAFATLFALAGACAGPSRDSDDFDRGQGRAPTAATLHAVARLLAAQDRGDECEGALERLIEQYPDFAPAYNDLAELHLRHGREAEAEAALEAGLERRPEDAVLLNNLGMCRLLRGDREAALASFTAASAAQPQDARSRANMALALGLLGRTEEAEALYLQVLGPEEARKNLATIATIRAGDRPAAPAPR